MKEKRVRGIRTSEGMILAKPDYDGHCYHFSYIQNDGWLVGWLVLGAAQDYVNLYILYYNSR